MNKSKYIEIPRKLYRKIETESRILEDGSFNSSFNVNEKILVILNINACVASGGWVPIGQGAATAIHLKAEEHPQAYQPPTQPRASPRPAPHYSTRHTEARSPVEVKWINPRKNK